MQNTGTDAACQCILQILGISKARLRGNKYEIFLKAINLHIQFLSGPALLEI